MASRDRSGRFSSQGAGMNGAGRIHHDWSKQTIFDWFKDPIPSARAFDAEGKSVPPYTVYINTRTGKVRHYKTDESGIVVRDESTGCPVVDTVRLPAPIRVEFV